jgi:hypothetical protein
MLQGGYGGTVIAENSSVQHANMICNVVVNTLSTFACYLAKLNK